MPRKSRTARRPNQIQTLAQPEGVFGAASRPIVGSDGLAFRPPSTPAEPIQRNSESEPTARNNFFVMDTSNGFWRVYSDGVVKDDRGAIVNITALEAKRMHAANQRARERRVRCAVELAEDILGRRLERSEFRQIRNTRGDVAEEVELVAGPITNAQRAAIERA